MNSSNDGYVYIPTNQKEFLYSVLNLPTLASQNEIRERHRALSLLFHPDKQHDERTKDTAAKKFLEIQKAYEVLSDPFLREVYDLFGEEGLNTRWPDGWRSKPVDELRTLLKQAKLDTRQKELDSFIRSSGHLMCKVDASSIFESYDNQLKWHEQFFNRLKEVEVPSFGLGNKLQTDLDEKTKLTLSAEMGTGRRQSSRAIFLTSNFLGTIRHQYSPRWAYQGTFSLLRDELFTLKSTYSDDDTGFSIQYRHPPRLLPIFPPPLTIALTRRLFRQSPTQGILVFDTGSIPIVSIGFVSPRKFDFTAESYIPEDSMDSKAQTPGSTSGLGVGEIYQKYSVALAGIGSSLSVEWGITFTEIAVQAKFALGLGVSGLTGMLTGTWASSQSEISASVGLDLRGVIMRLEFSYLGQRLMLPIIMSQDADAALAFCTTVIPTTAFFVGYHLILKPHRRRQRIAYFRAARKEHEEHKSASKRAAEETSALLRDTAKKCTQSEASKGGLVVIEATYGPSELEEQASDLTVDVTVAVQALVHNSQVYVPGHRTKAGIQGFYDPAPFVAKALRVRYLFCERTHYAEIPDYIPVVLPLADHLVQ